MPPPEKKYSSRVLWLGACLIQWMDWPLYCLRRRWGQVSHVRGQLQFLFNRAIMSKEVRACLYQSKGKIEFFAYLKIFQESKKSYESDELSRRCFYQSKMVPRLSLNFLTVLFTRKSLETNAIRKSPCYQWSSLKCAQQNNNPTGWHPNFTNVIFYSLPQK